MTLFEWLIAKYPAAKRQTLRRMVEDCRVRVNGEVARSVKVQVRENDRVEVKERARQRDSAPEAAAPPMPFRIVFEDEDVLVIEKPVGLLTSTTPREHRPTALAAVRAHVGTGVGLIHRLDRDASGLLVFSKNNAAYESLKQQFFKHTVERIYHAVVDGVLNPASGRIESRLVEVTDGSVHTTKRDDSGERAVTDYKTLRVAGKRSLLRVTLDTGRKHQIRAHLSERGAAIVNDRMYNPTRRTGRLMLAATELAFDHPRTGERMRFELPLPREMTALL